MHRMHMSCASRLSLFLSVALQAQVRVGADQRLLLKRAEQARVDADMWQRRAEQVRHTGKHSHQHHMQCNVQVTSQPIILLARAMCSA